MTQQLRTVIPFRKPLEALTRDEIVKNMAEHLVAAIIHGGLDADSDIDVIQCLMNTPERYQSRVVLNHMDDALAEADQMIIAREMSEGCRG